MSRKTALQDKTGELTARGFPIVYEGDTPKAVLVDIDLFIEMLRIAEEAEDREILEDPEILASLRRAREQDLAEDVRPFEELVRELGLEGEL